MLTSTMKNLLHRKGLLGATSITALLSSLSPSIAHAGAIGNFFGWAFSSIVAVAGIPGTLIGFIAYVINYLMGIIAGTLFSIGGWLLEWALQLNATIMGNPIIAVGWGMTRDLANLGFVLAIIVIAFATILRFESYGMKQALWKLIVAALLVNFSLVIAGVILDFSGVLSNTFIAGSSPEVGLQIHTFATNLSASFGVNKLLKVAVFEAGSGITTANAENFQNALNTFGGSLVSSIASIFFVALFTFFGAITLLVISIMVFIRYIILSLLLVVAPLAWLFWIFDDLKHLWSKWWNEFFRWTFFLPSALFFLNLAIYLALNRSDYVNAQLATMNPSDPYYANFGLQIASAPAQVGQMLLIIGLMYSGLIMSYSISGQFSKVASATGGWAAGKARDWGKRRARGLANQALALGARTDSTTGRTTTAVQRFAGTLARIPGLRGVSSAISNAVATARDPKAVAEYQARRLSNLTDAGLVAVATSATARANINPLLTAAVAAEVAKRNLTNNPRIQPRMDEFLSAAQMMGNLTDVLANRPELATPELVGGTNIEAAIARTMGKIKPSQADTISDVSLRVTNITDAQRHIVLNLTTGHISRIASEGTATQRTNLRNSLTTLAANRASLSPQEQAALNRIETSIASNPNLQL